MARQLRAITFALLLAVAATAAWAQTPAILNYTLTYEGPDEDALIRNAQMRALHSTVGTFCTDNRVVIARDLLDAFLDHNMAQYIASVTVAGRQVDQGLYRLRLDVAVYARTLEQALEEYRFLFHPRPTPLCFVFLSETLDEQRQEVPVAKPIVQEALDDAGLQVSSVAVLSPDSRIDVSEGSTDPTANSTLADALMNAERGGVELLFSGQCTTTLVSNEELYYDEYYFYETVLLLRMFRVDNGALLDEVVVRDTGGNPDDATAREIAIRKCVGRAIEQLMDTYHSRWPYEVLGQTDYHLVILDIDEEQLGLLEGKLGDLDPEAQVFRHSFHRDVAVLNLQYHSEFEGTRIQERNALVDFLTGLDTPQLRIESVEGNTVTARVALR